MVDCEQFLFFLEYLNERAICVCEQGVGRAPVLAKTRLSLALAPANLAVRGFGVPTPEHAFVQEGLRAAQPCERRTNYKAYPNQLERQIGVGNKAPQITVHNF